MIAVKEAANRLGVNYSTMVNWNKRGRFSFLKQGRNNYLHDEDFRRLVVSRLGQVERNNSLIPASKAARQLGCCKSTLWRMAAKENEPFIKANGTKCIKQKTILRMLLDKIDEGRSAEAVDEVFVDRDAIKDRYRDDPIANFVNENRDAFLEALFVADVSHPRLIGSLKYLMHAPDFLNSIINDYFGYEILKVVEHEGHAHDWELLGKKISTKALHTELFPRERKNGKGFTKANPIQLKNANGSDGSAVLHDGEIDYLLVFVVNPKADCKYGIYLYGGEQVNELLKDAVRHNPKCNKHGYDGNGQVKLYVERGDAIAALEMDDAMMEKLQAKYDCNVPAIVRDTKWLSDMAKIIKGQIDMTRQIIA